MMKHAVLIILALVFATTRIQAQRIKGSDTVLPIAQQTAERFMKLNPNARVTVTGGGTGVGISALLDETTDIAMASRGIKFSEKIRVNAIAPGFFIGNQNRAILINPDGSLTERSQKVIAKTPMKRFGDISELNGAVQFLCSDAASFITGAVLAVDGGFSAFSGV